MDSSGLLNASRMISTTAGWRSLIILSASAQLAQCAAGAVRHALRRPMPPSHKGRDDCSWALQSTWTLKIRQRHCHTPSSCACANSCVNRGLTALKKKFDRAAAQNDNRSHADWVSWMAGIRSNNTLCSEFLFCRNFFTNSGWSNGTPSTLKPCSCGGRE